MASETVIVTDPASVHVTVQTQGLQGPQGPAGPAGSSGGAVVEHTQSVPSTSWNITHAFTFEPQVLIVIDNESVLADIQYPTATIVVINFGSPQTGKAVLS